MRRKDKEITSVEWMEDVLRRGEWLSLGMCGADGRPYVVPLNYGYGGGFLIIHGAVSGMKIDLMRANPNVCFQVTLDEEVIRNESDPSEFSMKFRSVTGFGKAIFLEDIAEKREGLKVLMRHFDGPVEPMPDAMVARTAVIKIEITEMTGKNSGYPRPE